MATNQQEEHMMTLKALQKRIQQVREQISDAALAAGRRPEDITLIGVSKRFPAAYAAQAVAAGLDDLGENRVQEMLPKIDALADQQLYPRWHLIGTLQKNKVKYIIGRCHLIHSVDSLSLLSELSRRGEKAGVTTRVLLQVNASGEDSKHGFAPEKLIESAKQAFALPAIEVSGLMTMAPIADDPEDIKPVFEKTRVLYETIAALSDNKGTFQHLSMGMSQDYRQAIMCGATYVRIGTAIFGTRV